MNKILAKIICFLRGHKHRQSIFGGNRQWCERCHQFDPPYVNRIMITDDFWQPEKRDE